MQTDDGTLHWAKSSYRGFYPEPKHVVMLHFEKKKKKSFFLIELGI